MVWRRGLAYGQDLRDRVLLARAAEQSSRAVAARYGVSVSYVVQATQRRARTGESTARRSLGRPTSKMAAQPDATLGELRGWLLADRGVAVGVRDGVACAGPSWADAQKKQIHAAEQSRADVAEARAAWRVMQPSLDPAKLVFIDESWATTNMARRYGRGPRDERVLAPVPHGHWKTTTFLAGLRQDGLIAPLVLDGPINGVSFLAYVRQFLAPSLRPGDTVIMDNLSSHKVRGVRAAIEAVGASLLYLPPYSPDLNECANYLANSGYRHP